MRLTFINQFYTPDISPTAHLCASVAEHRAARGDCVTVITGAGGYVANVGGAHADAGPVKIVRVWTTGLGSKTVLKRLLDWSTFYAMALWRAAALPRQDVIVCLTTPPFIALAGLLHKFMHPRTRLILWNMDSYPEAVERTGMVRPGGLASRAMRGINRLLYRRLDHLICLDGAMARLLMKSYAPPGHRQRLSCTIIPNWERASLFPKVDIDSKWDDPVTQSLAGRFVVLYLGNTGFGHDFQTVLDAAELLRGAPVTFLFIGGGAKWKWLQEQREARKLDNVLLHGYIPKSQTPAAMRFAQCALITLDDFAVGVMSPSKLHSNLAMGLPVVYIGPAGSNVDEAITRFGCGISLRRGDPAGVVDFIRHLLSHPQALSDLRLRAREAFDAAYCDLQTLPQFDRIFDALQP